MNKKNAFTARAQLSQKMGSETENNLTGAIYADVIFAVEKSQLWQIYSQNMS